MNRHDRRAAERQQRKAPDRADITRLAMEALAGAADTATGATLMMADGEVLYLAADDARAMVNTAPARGNA